MLGRPALASLCSRSGLATLAITAGLDHAEGDGVVILDADLQDPPEVILDLPTDGLSSFFDNLLRWVAALDMPIALLGLI